MYLDNRVIKEGYELCLEKWAAKHKRCVDNVVKRSVQSSVGFCIEQVEITIVSSSGRRWRKRIEGANLVGREGGREGYDPRFDPRHQRYRLCLKIFKWMARRLTSWTLSNVNITMVDR